MIIISYGEGLVKTSVLTKIISGDIILYKINSLRSEK